MKSRSAATLPDLLAATEPIGDDEGLGRRVANRREEHSLGAFHRDIIMLLFERCCVALPTVHKCHSERSEESRVSCQLIRQILRLSPQDDITAQSLSAEANGGRKKPVKIFHAAASRFTRRQAPLRVRSRVLLRLRPNRYTTREYNELSRAAMRSGRNNASRSRTVRLIAWALYDAANSAFTTVIITFVFASYFTRQVASDEAAGTLLWGNAVAAGELSVALAGPILGAIADQTGMNKRWLAGFTFLCVAATALLWFVRPSPESTSFALLLVAIGVFASDCGLIFYNAMLPRLADAAHIGRWSGWSWGWAMQAGYSVLWSHWSSLSTRSNPGSTSIAKQPNIFGRRLCSSRAGTSCSPCRFFS